MTIVISLGKPQQSREWLFWDGEGHGELRVLPHDLQHAAPGRVVLNRQRELIHRLFEPALLRVHPRQIVGFIDRYAPLSQVGAERELRGSVFVRYKVECVSAGGNRGRANRVASSAPKRQTLPKGTRPPQILRGSPVMGSLV